jgi:DNA-binding beta-propeller fold protein YncE
VLQGTAIDPATGKPVTHYWTPDHINGLCRVDVDPVTGVGTMNRNTCVLFLGGGQIKAAQLSYDPQNQFIYVPDMSTQSKGVWRLRYLPSADNGNGAISIFDRTLLAPNCGVGGNLPWASALGPDGNLYLGFKKTPNIVRINHPAGFTQCSDAQVIGSSADGRISFALAFMGTDLWEADGRGLGVIVNAPACATAGAGTCNAVGVLTGNPALPNALASDPVNHVLYVGDPSNVYALNLAGAPGTATISTYATGFQFVFGLAVDPNTLAVGQAPLIYAGDDPSRGLIPGAGRIFKVQ